MEKTPPNEVEWQRKRMRKEKRKRKAQAGKL